MVEEEKFNFNDSKERELSQDRSNNRLTECFLKVKKRGKLGVSHKLRILHIWNGKVEYFPINEKTKELFNELNTLYTNDCKSQNKKEDLKKIYDKYKKQFEKEKPKAKSFFERYSIENLNPKTFKGFCNYPIKIKNADAKKDEEDNSENYWIIETYEECFLEAIREAQENIITDGRSSKYDYEDEKDKDSQEDYQDNVNKIEGNKKTEFEYRDIVHYIELVYQEKIHQYIELLKDINDNEKESREKKIENEINKEKKKLYLELNIYYCYRLFVKHCEKVVKKIIYDLSTFDKAEFHQRLHPIVFPNPYYFSQEQNSVLLYSIWGVNYTVTWNCLKSPFKSIPFSKGKWKGLKTQFKQKDYFQDFLMKIWSEAKQTKDFPTVPMSCIVDYNGFRVYCESDIFIDDESEVAQNKMAFIDDFANLIKITTDKEAADKSGLKYNLSSRSVSNMKNFELENFLLSAKEDFENSIDNSKGNTQLSIQTEQNKIDKNQIVPTEKQFLKALLKLINEEKNERKEIEDINFFSIKDDLPKIATDFSYLMNFDILIPERKFNNGESQNFFRQEIIMDKLEHDINEDKRKEPIEIGKKSIQPGNNILESQNQMSSSIEIKEKEYLLNIVKKNTFQNAPFLPDDIQRDFDQRFRALVRDLSTLYIVPYNSETLKIAFHHYGINMRYLGKVSDESKTAHVREICLIEMFARVCKRIVFDLLGQSTFNKAMGVFYEHIKELTTTLNKVPVSFNLLYGNEYLKSITQPVERGFQTYKGVEVTGLYLTGDEYPLKIPKDTEEKRNDFESSQGKNLSNFFSALFSQSKSIDLELYGEKMTTSQDLWNFIIKKMRVKYQVTNEDVFLYCAIDTIPINSLISAIQYHTGIKLPNFIRGNFENFATQKFEKTAFDGIIPTTKSTYYSFSNFLCKKYTMVPLRNEFGMRFPGNITYYQSKLNYYAEKYLFERKISHNFYYLYYLKILKSWDTEKKAKFGKDNTLKEFNKNSAIAYNYNMQFSPIFEENFDLFIELIRSQHQSKASLKSNKNQQIKAVQNKIDNHLLSSCEKVITICWNESHIFLSILKSTYAKALYKNTNSRKEEAKIFLLLEQSVKLAQNALGNFNIFVGHAAREAGLFYEKSFKFLEAKEMLFISYQAFKYHKTIMTKNYLYSIKYLTKTLLFLGYHEESLEYGMDLVKDIYKRIKSSSNILKSDNSIEPKKKEINYWEEIHHMDNFTLNLMKIAKSLRRYNDGVELGNILFNLISDPSNFCIQNFKNWIKICQIRVREMQKLKTDQTTYTDNVKNIIEIRVSENGKEKRINNVIKVYLKCLLGSLKGNELKTYSKAYVKYLHDTQGEKCTENQFYTLFFRRGNETFDEYFRNKILYFINQKFEAEKHQGNENVVNFNGALKDLRVLYFKFRDMKVFNHY